MGSKRVKTTLACCWIAAILGAAGGKSQGIWADLLTRRF